MSTAVRGRFARQPALDGVRGIAVALVLLFHQGWLSGGYVGVSVFFTLSGYLITSLALIEHDATGHFDVRAFYGRRIRRLLPASLVCLLAVMLLALTGVFAGVDHLRRDLWGALAQIYNWLVLGDGRSYAELVVGVDAARSPLDHYWSLAIEEQFYWVWPLALVVILRRRARGRITLMAALTLVFAASAPVIAAVWGGAAAYWSTPARLGELLVGALLAAVLHARRGRRLPRAVGLLGPLGLGAVVVAAVTWPSGSGPAYSGWLPLFALASVALIIGLQVPSGFRRVLAGRPLVVLGAISYGVYLFHWPVFVVLDEERTNLPGVPLFALRLVVTFGLAVLSFRYLESPVRRARPRRVVVVPVAGAIACSLVAVGVVLVPGGSRPYWMTAAAAEPLPAAPADTSPLVPAASTTGPESTPTSSTAPSTTAAADTAVAVEPAVLAASGTAAVPTAETTPASTAPASPATPTLPAVPARPIRVLVVGDSTAMATAVGLEAWEDLRPGYVDFTTLGHPGCGFFTDGWQRQDVDGSFAEQCAEHRADVAANLAWLQPDVVVGMVTHADTDDRTWTDPSGYLGPADQAFLEHLVAAYDTATVEFLTAGAADVLWIAPPVPDVGYGTAEQYLVDPARYDRYADALREVAARHPGQVAVIDLAGWLAAQPTVLERPDGMHWSSDAATAIAEQFLAPVIVSAALS